jgi:hypothetical protein
MVEEVKAEGMVAQAESVTVQVTALVVRPSKDLIESDADAQPWRAFMQDQIKCRKSIEEQIDPLIESAHGRHKALVAKKKELVASFIAGEQDAKSKLSAFVQAEEAKRQAEFQKAQEEAKRKAMAEAKAAGDKELAKAIKTGVVPVVADAPPPAPVKVAGFSTRKEKRGTITNKLSFLSWVIRTGQVALVDVNETELNAMIRRQNGQQAIPGVQISEVTINSAR